MKRIKIPVVLIVCTLLLFTSCRSNDRSAQDGGVSASNGSVGGEPGTASMNNTNKEEVVEINFAGVTSDSAKEAAVVWKEVVERESGGSIKVILYPDNILADDVVAVENTQAGNIQMATSSTSVLCGMFPDFYLFDTPYLFLSNEHVYEVMDGQFGQSLLNSLEDYGLKGMMFWENGFRCMTNNIRPVSLPEHVEGIRIRVMENDIHIAAWEALGAEPHPMPFQSVFGVMQQGYIDAQENSLGVVDANKFYEINQYISLTNHVYTPYIIVMNLEVWNGLSNSQKTALDIANREATAYQRKRSQELEEAILAGLQAAGVNVIELNQQEREAFQAVISSNNIFDLVKEKMVHPEYMDLILN